MDKEFFVMMYSPNGKTLIPIVEGIEGNENVAMYVSEEEARMDMNGHSAAEHFGYEIFQVGMGI